MVVPKRPLDPATEVIHRSDSGTLTYADGHRRKHNLENTLENISSLLDNLHGDNADDNNGEYNRIQQNMKFLFSTVASHQMDLLGDLSSVIESFKAGLMSPEQLEMMIKAEQDRSEMILGLAGRVGDHLQDLFKMIEAILEHVETGSPLPVGGLSGLGGSVRSQMNLLFESVDSISRIINTPPANLQQTFEDIEKDIAVAVNDVVRNRAAMSPMMLTPLVNPNSFPSGKDTTTLDIPGATMVSSNKSTKSPSRVEAFSRNGTESRRYGSSPTKEVTFQRNLPASREGRRAAYCLDSSSQTEPWDFDDYYDNNNNNNNNGSGNGSDIDQWSAFNKADSMSSMSSQFSDDIDADGDDKISHLSSDGVDANSNKSSRPKSNQSSRVSEKRTMDNLPINIDLRESKRVGSGQSTDSHSNNSNEAAYHTGNTRPPSSEFSPAPLSPRQRSMAVDSSQLQQMQTAVSNVKEKRQGGHGHGHGAHGHHLKKHASNRVSTDH